MGFINDICPSPADRPAAELDGGSTLACDSKNPQTTAFIYKTMSEPQVGMVSYFKVYASVMKPGDELYNMDHQVAERINQLLLPRVKQSGR